METSNNTKPSIPVQQKQKSKKKSPPKPKASGSPSPQGKAKGVISMHEGIKGFGPKPLLPPVSSSGDESVSGTLTADTNRVGAVVHAILCQAGMVINDSAAQTNYAFAYRFLTQYVLNCWLGLPQTTELDLAPAVFWDYCDAGTAKRTRGFNMCFTAQSVPEASMAAPSIANFGSAVGLVSTGTTSGYLTVDSTITTGYTSTAGASAAKDIFNNCLESLDCVTRKAYPSRIKDDDFSVFAAPMADTVGGSNYAYMQGGTRNMITTIVKGPRHLCKTDWLMACSGCLNNDTSHPWILAPSLGQFCSGPQAFIVHRIINKFRGTEKKRHRVVLKFIDANDVIVLVDAIAKQVEGITGSITSCFNNSNSLLGRNAFIWLMYSYLGGLTSEWSAVSAGHQVYNPTLSSWRPALRCGPADTPPSFLKALHLPHLIARGLSCLFPYKRGNTMFYPVFYIGSTMVTNTNTTATYGTDSIITAIYDADTGYVHLTTSQAAMGVNPKLGDIEKQWNGAISVAQQFVPWGAAPTERTTNLACLTRYVNGSTGAFLGLLHEEPIDDALNGLISLSILPQYVSATSVPDMASRSYAQVLYKEHKYLAVMRLATNIQSYLTDQILNSVHSGIAADPNASADSDAVESQYLEGVPGVVNQAIGGAVAYGVGQALQHMPTIGGIAGHAANALVGSGLLNRMQGRPRAYYHV